jgi:hypothetical protein
LEPSRLSKKLEKKRLDIKHAPYNVAFEALPATVVSKVLANAIGVVTVA